MTAGRRYYLAQTLDMSIGAYGLTLLGPAAALGVPDKNAAHLTAQIELEPASGATIKLGPARRCVTSKLAPSPAPRAGLAARSSGRDQALVCRGRKARPQDDWLVGSVNDVSIERVSVVGFHTGILASGPRFKICHCLIRRGRSRG